MAEWNMGNIHVRNWVWEKKGQQFKGDVHNFDHATLVMAGAVHCRFTRKDGSLIYEGDYGRGYTNGPYITIKAEVVHDFTSIEDNTEIWCVYSHRFPDGSISEHPTGFAPAYN